MFSRMDTWPYFCRHTPQLRTMASFAQRYPTHNWYLSTITLHLPYRFMAPGAVKRMWGVNFDKHLSTKRGKNIEWLSVEFVCAASPKHKHFCIEINLKIDSIDGCLIVGQRTWKQQCWKIRIGDLMKTTFTPSLNLRIRISLNRKHTTIQRSSMSLVRFVIGNWDGDSISFWAI